MNKAAIVKAALANHKKKRGKSYPAKNAHENPAIQNEEHTPGKKQPLPLKHDTGGKPVKSNSPFWVKPKGTAENPDKTTDPSKKPKKVVKRPKYFQKAKTRGGA